MSLKFRDCDFIVEGETLSLVEFYLTELNFCMMRCYSKEKKMYTSFNLGVYDVTNNIFIDIIKKYLQEEKQRRVTFYLENAVWTFAKTMKTIPHFWTLKKQWNPKEFNEVIEYMDKNYERKTFGNKMYRYTLLNNYKYWHMESDSSKVTLINRAKI
jgi:hypothetical protein